MLMNYRLLLPALFITLALGSCKKDSETQLEGDWLFPIAKGELSLNSMQSLKNLKYNIQVPAQSLNVPTNVPVSSPGLQLKYVGPFGVQITDWLHRLDVDTLAFTGSLNNFFPIPIGAGTKVVMRTSRDTSSNSNVAGTAVIPNTVPPGGLFSFDISVLNKSLSDSVFFFLEDFNSPPYSNVTFTTTATQLNITLKVLTASFVQIYTNRSFTSTDTTEFDGSSIDRQTNSNNAVLHDTAARGVINVFADNGLPAHTRIQLYFLDASKTRVLDSLFTPTAFQIEGGRTDAAGNPQYVASTSAKVPINQLKVNHMKQAAYVVSQFNFNTIGYPSPYVAANKAPRLQVQLTGDLKLNIKF